MELSTTSKDILSREPQKQIGAIVSMVNSGNINPLEAKLVFSEIKKTLEQAEKNIATTLIEFAETNELDKFPYKLEGYEVSMQEGSGRYDFTGIEAIANLEEQLKSLKEQHKEAHKQHLKGQMLVTDDGEVIEPAGFKSYGKQVRFKKLR
jgi:polyhydroxyalkanoate synthesis regulator phasin